MRSEFKDKMREDRKKALKQWGEIANKIGTLAEDIVAPFRWFNRPRLNRNVSVQAASLNQHRGA